MQMPQSSTRSSGPARGHDSCMLISLHAARLGSLQLLSVAITATAMRVSRTQFTRGMSTSSSSKPMIARIRMAAYHAPASLKPEIPSMMSLAIWDVDVVQLDRLQACGPRACMLLVNVPFENSNFSARTSSARRVFA